MFVFKREELLAGKIFELDIFELQYHINGGVITFEEVVSEFNNPNWDKEN